MASAISRGQIELRGAGITPSRHGPITRAGGVYSKIPDVELEADVLDPSAPASLPRQARLI